MYIVKLLAGGYPDNDHEFCEMRINNITIGRDGCIVIILEVSHITVTVIKHIAAKIQLQYIEIHFQFVFILIIHPLYKNENK